jgi:hypothetical protein
MRVVNKFIIGILLLSILSISLISAVPSTMTSSNATVITPGASGILTGASSVFNCSITDRSYTNENWTHVRVYLQSASETANVSEVLVSGWILNTTAYDLNGTINSWQVEDGNDYTIKCQFINDSITAPNVRYVNITRSGITINNTVPHAPTSLLPTSDTDGTVTFSGSVTDNETTSCKLVFNGINPGASSYDMTYSGTSCSKTLTNVPDQTYNWVIRASDESDTTDSSLQTTIVNIQSSASQLIASESQPKTSFFITNGKLSTGGIVVILLVIAGIVIGLYVVIKKN